MLRDRDNNLEINIEGIGSPDVVIFDWDDTLTHSRGLITIAFQHTLNVLGVQEDEVPLKKDRSGFGYRSLRDTFPEIFGEKWEEAAKIFYEYYLQHHLDYIEPLLGSSEVLELLYEFKIPTYIISNKKGIVLRQEVKALNWQKYFNRIIGSTDSSMDKPNPDLVYWALEDSFHPNKHNIWFIGDSIIDIECANASGCVPLLFGEDKDIAKKLQHFSEDWNYYRVNNHRSMLCLLDNIINTNK